MSHVHAALRTRYSGREWAYFEEVHNETGMASQSADGIAMNMYQSRGLAIHGFEVKCFRSDWLRELKKPDKAEAIFKYCDYWWIAAAEGVVLKPDTELPPTWGLLVLNNDGKLIQKKAAPKLKAKLLTREFVAALLRRASESSPSEQTLRQTRLTARAEGCASMKEHYEAIIADEKKSHEKTKLVISEFERISGTYLNNWNYGSIARIVALLQNQDERYRIADRIKNEIDNCKTYLAANEQLSEQLKKIEMTKPVVEEEL